MNLSDFAPIPSDLVHQGDDPVLDAQLRRQGRHVYEALVLLQHEDEGEGLRQLR